MVDFSVVESRQAYYKHTFLTDSFKNINKYGGNRKSNKAINIKLSRGGILLKSVQHRIADIPVRKERHITYNELTNKFHGQQFAVSTHKRMKIRCSERI